MCFLRFVALFGVAPPREVCNTFLTFSFSRDGDNTEKALPTPLMMPSRALTLATSDAHLVTTVSVALLATARPFFLATTTSSARYWPSSAPATAAPARML